MPTVVSFRKKGSNEPWKTGKDYIAVDEELCAAFGVTPDPVKWYHSWMDFFTMGIAFGRTPEEVIEDNEDSAKQADNEEMRQAYLHYSRIAKWLNEHYEWSAYREMKR